MLERWFFGRSGACGIYLVAVEDVGVGDAYVEMFEYSFRLLSGFEGVVYREIAFSFDLGSEL